MKFKKFGTIKYAEKDFNESLLPHDRKSQFKFIFKTRKNLLFLIGFVLLLFSLLLLISFLLKDFMINNAYLQLQDKQINDEEMMLFMMSNQLLFSIISVALFFIVTIGLSGIFEIYKKLIFGLPIFFKNDFKKGIKSNIKSFMMISLFFGILIILVNVGFRFFFFTFWFWIILIIFLVLVLPYFVGMYFYKSIYNAGIKLTLKNAAILYGVTSIKGIGLSLGLIIIPFVSNVLADLLIITPAINEFIMVAYIILFAPIYLLMMYSYYYSVFDQKINKLNFPNYYMKGLYNPKKNEEVKNSEN